MLPVFNASQLSPYLYPYIIATPQGVFEFEGVLIPRRGDTQPPSERERIRLIPLEYGKVAKLNVTCTCTWQGET